MSDPVQVVCNKTGNTHYPTGRILPEAGWRRYACPCDHNCGSVEYRELDGVFDVFTGP